MAAFNRNPWPQSSESARTSRAGGHDAGKSRERRASARFPARLTVRGSYGCYRGRAEVGLVGDASYHVFAAGEKRQTSTEYRV
jgi:hypothetical protein